MEEIVALWMKNPMFACGGRELCTKLAEEFPPQSFEAEAAVVTAGDEVRSQYVLLDGLLRVFHRTSDGRETIVKLLHAPATFGEMELLHHLPYLESVVSVDASLLAAIPRGRYLELMAEHPAVLMEQLRNLAGAFCVAARNELQILAPFEQRIANFVLTFADVYGRATQEGVMITHPLPQKQIANALGATKRGVIKVLTSWREKGIIRRHGEKLFLLKPEFLETLARPIRGSLRYYIGMPLQEIDYRQSASRGHLAVLRGPRPCLGRHAVVGDELLIGRAAHCALLLPDETVELVHCRLYRATTGGRFWIEDLKSLNGTFLNNQALQRRRVLRDGDIIQVGATTLRFQMTSDL